jgi:mannose-6-phosphate isomerase-like protein (cupin superfamily)
MKAGKVWGTTELLLRTPLIEVHRLEVLPNSFCSMHCHRYKHNAFYVSTGELYIEVAKNDYDLTDTTLLGPGEFTTVPPNEYHRFRTGERGMQGIEIYYLEPLSLDIIRKTVGGKQ